MLQFLRSSRHAPVPDPPQIEVPARTKNGPDSSPAPVAREAKTGSPIPDKPQAALPRLFVQSNYVTAVRASDGAVLSRGVAAQPAEIVELYGTGFKNMVPGAVDSSTKPTSNLVRVSIGSIPAEVRFAGLVGPGLYQIDVVVPPDLPSGDYPVSVSVGAITTQGEGLMKIAQVQDASHETVGRYSEFVRKAIAEDALLTDTGAG
jgi:uncharacterized protein (TIGR03437 family)